MPIVNLDHSFLRGLAWTGAAKWSVQIITWASTFALARLLTPTDFGIFAMAHLFLGLVSILTDFGLNATIMNHHELAERDIAEANGLAVILGILGALVVAVAAYPIAWFFGEPRLRPLVVVLSLTFIFGALRTVPEALLQRDLRFRALGAIEAAQSLMAAMTTVAAAFVGLSHWALVVGFVVPQALATFATARLRKCGFRLPTQRLLPLFRFSRDVVVGRLSWYIYETADFMVAGRTLGPTTLGAYSLAWTIASIPVSRLAALVARVTPAFFARLQNDPSRMKRLLLNTTAGIGILTLPAAVGLVLVADVLVPTLLGPRWGEAVLPLQILAAGATLRCLDMLFPQVLVALRHTRFPMMTSLAMALLLPPSFLLGSTKGAPGIAAVWLCVYPLFIIPLAWRVFRLIDLRLREYLASLGPAVQGSVCMVLAVLLVRHVTPSTLPSGLILAILVSAGFVAYALSAVVPNREHIRSILRLLRNPPLPAGGGD